MEDCNKNDYEPTRYDNEVSSTNAPTSDRLTSEQGQDQHEPPLFNFPSLSTPVLSWTKLTEQSIKESDTTSLPELESTNKLSQGSQAQAKLLRSIARKKKIAAGFGPGPALNLLTLEDLEPSDVKPAPGRKRRREQKDDKIDFFCPVHSGGGSATGRVVCTPREKIQAEMLHCFQRFKSNLKNPKFPENFDNTKPICVQLRRLMEAKRQRMAEPTPSPGGLDLPPNDQEKEEATDDRRSGARAVAVAAAKHVVDKAKQQKKKRLSAD